MARLLMYMDDIVTGCVVGNSQQGGSSITCPMPPIGDAIKTNPNVTLAAKELSYALAGLAQNFTYIDNIVTGCVVGSSWQGGHQALHAPASD